MRENMKHQVKISDNCLDVLIIEKQEKNLRKPYI